MKLEDAIVWQSSVSGMVGLKGHRSVGGLRASMFNSVTEVPEVDSCSLARFMDYFQRSKNDSRGDNHTSPHRGGVDGS